MNERIIDSYYINKYT